MKVEFPETQLSQRSDSISSAKSPGGMVDIDGESCYKIENVDEMDPFLINLVSANNHWMFIASNGALTAGRCDANNALFPYCTQDKLFELAHTVGSVTLLWVERSGYASPELWEPFRGLSEADETQTNLYKNASGNKLIFEELNYRLGVFFRYQWTFSDSYGFVRKAFVGNLEPNPLKIRILDGIQNLVPYGLDQAFVNRFSNLADAYKKCELLPPENLGIYYLSSIPTDRAEPSEGLRATVAWSHGLGVKSTLLSTGQLERFRDREALDKETDKRGVRGAYILESEFELGPNEEREWWIVADINQDACQVESLRRKIRSDSVVGLLDLEVRKNADDLRRKVASADGLTMTSDRLRDNRHYSNGLFNIMRGGVFNDGYRVELSDFASYLNSRNRNVHSELATQITRLQESSETIRYDQLVEWAMDFGDSNLVRLAAEYLPLTFSRRHGDPSRPWNRFSIETQDKYGKPTLRYEGNWRDIFQNWEALSYSFPGYLNGMIMRFLNATTADGYNPYRITRDGIDWEVVEADSPWSNIGYWGDHQIVYLLKLLETYDRFHPGALNSSLDANHFVYALVPYRIRSFSQILSNPRSTVDFSEDDARMVADRCSNLGSDGKLLAREDGTINKASLIEKLLNPLLSKLSNFIPDAGIWMNTQRPEWNDANNALVGYGVSVVTLCYVNRYIAFLSKILRSEQDDRTYSLNENIANFLFSQCREFEGFEERLTTGFDAESRMDMTRALGEGGESFRNRLYERGLSEMKVSVSNRVILDYLEIAEKYVEASIDANGRPDGMYHSYNLLRASEGKCIEIDRLSIMLEGQVAALSSGRLSTVKVLKLLDSLRESSLYREDVQSYLLYPDRDLPTFLEKNRVAETAVQGSPLLLEMLARKDPRIIQMDEGGTYRFSGDFRNSGDLLAELRVVCKDYLEWESDSEIAVIESIFENTFDHRRFTGRSSTFFAYEGLGSVYWHMVSKLVLAIQEKWKEAAETDADPKNVKALAEHYFTTFRGLGVYKSPREYGAFPIDAYSHTPKHAGAQQPGMTGQVKEDLITRWVELGLKIEAGRIHFEPGLLTRSSFLEEAAVFQYVGSDGSFISRTLEARELAYTCCQSLIVYKIGSCSRVRLRWADNSETTRAAASLTCEESHSIFFREGSILEVIVTIPEQALYQGDNS